MAISVTGISELRGCVNQLDSLLVNSVEVSENVKQTLQELGNLIHGNGIEKTMDYYALYMHAGDLGAFGDFVHDCADTCKIVKEVLQQYQISVETVESELVSVQQILEGIQL